MTDIKPAKMPDDLCVELCALAVQQWREGTNQRMMIARLTLDSQPFGFTWEDVDSLREIARRLTFDQKDGKSGRCLFAIADRIVDLLPPRDR